MKATLEKKVYLEIEIPENELYPGFVVYEGPNHQFRGTYHHSSGTIYTEVYDTILHIKGRGKKNV